MTSRSPLVIVGGQTEQLQAADTLAVNQPVANVDAVDRQTFYDVFANPNDPYTYTYENLANYPNTGATTTREVDYTRVWIPANRTITKMRAFIVSGANGSIQIQFGLYNQATATSITGTPNSRVANTAADTPPNAFTGFRTVNLATPYVTPTAGFYWLAFQANSGGLQVAMSSVYQAGYANRREEIPGTFTLPTTAGTTTQPKSAIIYVMAVE